MPRAYEETTEPVSELSNAEQVVDKAYRTLKDYSEYAQKNLREAEEKAKYWMNEYKVVQRFLATDQSDDGKAEKGFDEEF